MINEYQFLQWVIIHGDSGCSFLTAYRQAYGSSPLAWSKGRQPSGTVLHSSRKPGDSHDDSESCCQHHKNCPGIIIMTIIIIIWLNRTTDQYDSSVCTLKITQWHVLSNWYVSQEVTSAILCRLCESVDHILKHKPRMHSTISRLWYNYGVFWWMLTSKVSCTLLTWGLVSSGGPDFGDGCFAACGSRL